MNRIARRPPGVDVTAEESNAFLKGSCQGGRGASGKWSPAEEGLQRLSPSSPGSPFPPAYVERVKALKAQQPLLLELDQAIKGAVKVCGNRRLAELSTLAKHGLAQDSVAPSDVQQLIETLQDAITGEVAWWPHEASGSKPLWSPQTSSYASLVSPRVSQIVPAPKAAKSELGGSVGSSSSNSGGRKSNRSRSSKVVRVTNRQQPPQQLEKGKKTGSGTTVAVGKVVRVTNRQQPPQQLEKGKKTGSGTTVEVGKVVRVTNRQQPPQQLEKGKKTGSGTTVEIGDGSTKHLEKVEPGSRAHYDPSRSVSAYRRKQRSAEKRQQAEQELQEAEKIKTADVSKERMKEAKERERREWHDRMAKLKGAKDRAQKRRLAAETELVRQCEEVQARERVAQEARDVVSAVEEERKAKVFAVCQGCEHCERLYHILPSLTPAVVVAAEARRQMADAETDDTPSKYRPGAITAHDGVCDGCEACSKLSWLMKPPRSSRVLGDAGHSKQSAFAID